MCSLADCERLRYGRQARDNAVAIESALRDMNRVLTDMLVFSRDLRLNLYQHSLPRLLDEVIAECRPEAAQRRVQLRAGSPAPIEVTLDKLKIKQAVANVLRNAIELSPEGEDVSIEARIDGGVVEVTVADRGQGPRGEDLGRGRQGKRGSVQDSLTDRRTTIGGAKSQILS